MCLSPHVAVDEVEEISRIVEEIELSSGHVFVTKYGDVVAEKTIDENSTFWCTECFYENVDRMKWFRQRAGKDTGDKT
jgi:hypothetical protein